MSQVVPCAALVLALFAREAHARFLSVDPVAASHTDMTQQNRYAYARGAPYTIVDPDGRWGIIPYHRNESAPVLPTPGPPIAVLPTPTGRITSGYGVRRHPITGQQGLHNGTDFSAKRGNTVRATQNGQVARIASGGPSGNRILVHNHDGSLSGYAHVRPMEGIVEGAAVRRGQAIAVSDGSGRITAPHLHYIYKPGTVHAPANASTPNVDPMASQLKRYAGGR
jgi:murein DD-endopeptidase MepM/ murein hydrolase activator NlpD